MDQPRGSVYCRGEQIAVAAKCFEVIGVTSISTLPPLEKMSTLTFRSAAQY